MPKKVQSPKKYEEVFGTLVVIPPDGGWGWIIVTAAFIINFVADGTMYSYGLFIDVIAENLHTKTGSVTWAGSIMTGFYYLFGPLICAATNRLGFRIVSFIGGIFAATSFVLSSFVKDVKIFIVAYGVVGGIGFGMLYIPSVIAVGFYFDRWRGVASSLSLVGAAAGNIAVPQIILVLLKEYNWREKFLWFAGLCLLCAMGTLLYKPLKPVNIYSEDDDDQVKFHTMINKYNDPEDKLMKSAVSLRRIGSGFISQYSYKSFTSMATSMPAGHRFSDSPSDGAQCRCCRCWENCCYELKDLYKCRKGRKFLATPSRPMYRDDILFTGSIYTLRGRDRNNVETLDYHLSVTRPTTGKDIEEDNKWCMCCPETAKRTLQTMLDFNSMKSPAFACVMISSFLTMFGYYSPIIFITQRCIENGMETTLSGFLLSSVGAANLVGRIVSAIITAFPNVSALYVTIASLILSGSSTIVSVYFNHAIAQFAFCSIYGFTAATMLSMKPLLIVELFGLDKLSNSFGLMAMFQGLAILGGLPLGGILYDLTHSYDYVFLVAGGFILLSGVILIPVTKILKWEKKKLERKAAEEAAKTKTGKKRRK